MSFLKKRSRVLPVMIVLLAAVLAAGTFVLFDQWQRQKDADFTAMTSARLDAGVTAIRTQESDRAEFLNTEYTRLLDERMIQEEEIAVQQAEQAELKRQEQQRVEAVRQKAEAERAAAAQRADLERIAAEKARAEEASRLAAAQVAAKQATVIASEQQKATAEKDERARLSAQIKEQEAVAIAENDAYLARGITPTVALDVPVIYQNPELPNGCEVSALATLINYVDAYVDKCWLSDSFLPKFPFYTVGADKTRAGGDPSLYYAGDPRSNSNAYYCFAGPLVTAANNYFVEIGVGKSAIDLSGATEEDLIHQLDMGYPVVVWGTLSMGDAYTYEGSAWIIDEATGAKHVPFINLHCVVLTGYDDEYFLFSDPIRGKVAFKRSTFMNAFQQIGARAMTIY